MKMLDHENVAKESVLNKYNDLLPNNEIFDIQDKINSKSPFSKRTEIILWS